MMFPDLMFQGKPLPLDGIMSTYVVERFSTGAGVLVIFGLLAAGMSTLESLIQSLSITITQDLVRPDSASVPIIWISTRSIARLSLD
jgi:sodium/pantothenate symporter